MKLELDEGRVFGARYWTVRPIPSWDINGDSTRSASFKEMSSSYREVVEQYSNDNILLNIIRASVKA
jgi:hypothetical protein